MKTNLLRIPAVNIFICALAAFLSFHIVPSLQAAQKAVFEMILDGKTMKVVMNGKEEHVRLIGVDIPLGTYEATGYIKSVIAEGDKIEIDVDMKERDEDGDLLGYVYFGKGRMLNLELIRNGLAVPDITPPNVTHESKFKEALRYAREKKLGIWK